MSSSAEKHWEQQLYCEDVSIDSELSPISIPMTLQRLVMEAGANRDLSLMHHDRDIAQATGSPDAFANTYFILGMFERLLREWMGLKGQIKKINSLRMKTFNCPGSLLTFKAKITSLEENNTVALNLWVESENGTTVTAEAIVELPQRPM